MNFNLNPLAVNLFWLSTYPEHYKFLQIIEKKELWTKNLNCLEALTFQFYLLKNQSLTNNTYIVPIIEILNYLPLSVMLYILMWMDKNYQTLSFEYVMTARKNIVGHVFLARLKLLSDSNNFTQIYRPLNSPILNKLLQKF